MTFAGREEMLTISFDLYNFVKLNLYVCKPTP
jgi:hypothetical protein